MRDVQSTWVFYRDRDSWRWRRIDREGNVHESSERSYAHLLECIAAAKTEGYDSNSDVRFVSWST
jgi:hypothetical protein